MALTDERVTAYLKGKTDGSHNAALLSQMRDILLRVDPYSTVLYCFRLPVKEITDSNGSACYLVKVGKREAGNISNNGKNNRSYAYTAVAKVASRFADHKKSFKENIDIFGSASGLKHNGKKLKKKAPELTYEDIQDADFLKANADPAYKDFCCILKGGDEQLLKQSLPTITQAKKLMQMYKKPGQSMQPAWTEVRVMTLKTFELIRASFAAGTLQGLQRFIEIANADKPVFPLKFTDVFVNSTNGGDSSDEAPAKETKKKGVKKISKKAKDGVQKVAKKKSSKNGSKKGSKKKSSKKNSKKSSKKSCKKGAGPAKTKSKS